MSILVINSGSSSIKAALFEEQTTHSLFQVKLAGLGEKHAVLKIDKQSKIIGKMDHSAAIQTLFDSLTENGFNLTDITAVGHRVLHGGEKFLETTSINDAVEAVIESMIPLAPLHNPACLAGIRMARHLLTHCPHFAVFDTAFHSTLPTRAKIYALPADIKSNFPLRRFGFHGISHEYVSNVVANTLQTPIRNLRIISCHLGNGCSITAIEGGRSVETSMGMTPLEGLVMGSRSGDIDPGLLIQLFNEKVVNSADELDNLLNRKSGLLGMTGTNNMIEIEERAANGDEACRLAIHVFAHRARKYVGAYAAVMAGVDVILFTGGIGENSAYIRQRISQQFDFLGASINSDINRDVKLSKEQNIVDISNQTSRVKIFVVATNEELAIAHAVTTKLKVTSIAIDPPVIPVAVSARHVHLTTESVEALFGVGHELTPEFPLSQPGQFASKEKVTLVGSRNSLEHVRVLGPTRSKNQVEISRSDEFFLGIDAPVRASGHTENTPGISLVGPAGTVILQEGVICALRHVHMHPDDAKQFNVQNGDLINVAIDSDNRDLVFNDVLIRVDPNFKLEMHIDTDEANAAGLMPHGVGTLVRINKDARVMNLTNQT